MDQTLIFMWNKRRCVLGCHHDMTFPHVDMEFFIFVMSIVCGLHVSAGCTVLNLHWCLRCKRTESIRMRWSVNQFSKPRFPMSIQVFFYSFCLQTPSGRIQAWTKEISKTEEDNKYNPKWLIKKMETLSNTALNSIQ